MRESPGVPKRFQDQAAQKIATVDGSELVRLDLAGAAMARTDYLAAHYFIAAGGPYRHTKNKPLAAG
jgi:hypothetical protein